MVGTVSVRGGRRVVGRRLVVAFIVLSGAACSSSAASSAKPVSLALVVGERSNSAGVSWPAVEPLLPTEAVAGTRIVVVGVDGSPSGVELFDGLVEDHDYSGDREDDLARVRIGVRKAVESAASVQPEADPLGAIASAARAVRSGSGSCTIVVADSLLATVGPLDLRDGTLLGADPDDVAQALAERGELPDLHRCAVRVRGAGQVSAPQADLGEHQQRQLRALWQAVFTQAGAAPTTWDDALTSTPAPVGLPPVTPVTFPAAAALVVPQNPCAAVLDTTTVAFASNTAVFVDEDAARAAVAAVAAHLADCPGRITLTGTTAAWGTEEGRRQLSLERAGAVRDVLAPAIGADPASMSVVGAGSDFPEYVPDHDDAGHLVPALAARNRSVRITVSP